MNHKLAFATLLSSALLSAAAYGRDTIGTPTTGGSGCPQGSTEFTEFDRNSGTGEIEFDSFLIENTGDSTIQRVNCAIAIPVSPPAGVSYSIYDLRIDGSSEGAGRDGRSADDFRFDAEDFVGGQLGPRMSLALGGIEGEFSRTLSFEAGNPAAVWTPCGTPALLRINTGLRSNGSPQQQTLSIAKMTYKIAFRRCN